MNDIVFHFASGASLFSGAICVLAAMGLSFAPPRRGLGVLVRMLAALGLILILVSSTPLPAVLYLLLALAVLGFLIGHDAEEGRRRQLLLISRAAAIPLCVLAIVLEAPHWPQHKLPATQHSRVYVLGDSISAGLEDDERPWPSLLREQHGLDLINLAQAGATVSIAQEQAERLTAGPALVILEIGGNDLLDFHLERAFERPREFERDLEELLRQVSAPDRQLVMFELPLPPFHQRFGAIQRSLAEKYQVTLIPKRRISKILRRGALTSDGLHLSPAGHQAMAELVWETIKDAIADNPPDG